MAGTAGYGDNGGHASFAVVEGRRQQSQGPFDIVVMNPPYAKLGADSAHRHALAAYGMDCPNLYAAFMTLGVRALAAGGQLVAITPRSFANGPYFERFRKHLLSSIAVDRLHTFESRSTVFADAGVLQENIVLAGYQARPAGSRCVVEVDRSRRLRYNPRHADKRRGMR